MAKKNVIKEKSFDFAVEVVKEMRVLMKRENEFVLTKQLTRSATSIGANVEEGSQAESKKDFIHKLSISYKEAHESHYWIRLLMATDLLNEEKGKELKKKCDELIRILSAILRTSKN